MHFFGTKEARQPELNPEELKVREGLKAELGKLKSQALELVAKFGGNIPQAFTLFLESIDLEISQFEAQSTERLKDRIKDLAETLKYYKIPGNN